MGDEIFYIKITDNFKARTIYYNVGFYARNKSNTDVEIESSSADKINHLWEEDIIKIGNSAVKLRFYTPHDEKGNKKFNAETLELTVLGEESGKSVLRKLEIITGISIES